MKCLNCHYDNSVESTVCSSCGADLTSKALENVKDDNFVGPWIIGGFVCAGISLFIFPPLFGGLGIFFGYKASKGSQGIGVFVMIVSALCMAIGMYFGIIEMLKIYKS